MLQAAFRAAHTLKGMAGVIGHTRMVRLTHALETVLDGVRKGDVQISTPLIDLSLDAVEGLRQLREEVTSREECDVNLDGLLARFQAPANTSPKPEAVNPAPGAPRADAPTPEISAAAEGMLTLEVRANIGPNSFASAARAFQLMLVLQELGVIQEMTPSQEQIETASPVSSFSARLITGCPVAEVLDALAGVPEVYNLTVTDPCTPSPASLTAKDEENKDEIAAQKPEPANSDAKPVKSQKNERTQANMIVRTSVERLDNLMGLVGELITDRNHLFQIRNQMARRGGGGGSTAVGGSNTAGGGSTAGEDKPRH